MGCGGTLATNIAEHRFDRGYIMVYPPAGAIWLGMLDSQTGPSNSQAAAVGIPGLPSSGSAPHAFQRVCGVPACPPQQVTRTAAQNRAHTENGAAARTFDTYHCGIEFRWHVIQNARKRVDIEQNSPLLPTVSFHTRNRYPRRIPCSTTIMLMCSHPRRRCTHRREG
jgi:hypothetical protein